MILLLHLLLLLVWGVHLNHLPQRQMLLRRRHQLRKLIQFHLHHHCLVRVKREVCYLLLRH